jgi:hypothetical protein
MLGEIPLPSWIPKGIQRAYWMKWIKQNDETRDMVTWIIPIFSPLRPCAHGQTSQGLLRGTKFWMTEEIRWIASLDWWQEICIELSRTSYDQLVVVTQRFWPSVNFDQESLVACGPCSGWSRIDEDVVRNGLNHQVFSILGWCTSSTARVLYKYSIIQYSKSVFSPRTIWVCLKMGCIWLYHAISFYIMVINGDYI